MDICRLVQDSAVAAAPDDVRHDFSRALDVRNAVLDAVWSIEGYEDMPVDRQREICDEIRLGLLDEWV